MHSIKHPFPAGKLPVRGRFWNGCMLIGSSAMTNIRRIHRYLNARIEKNQQVKMVDDKGTQSSEKKVDSLLGLMKTFFIGFSKSSPFYGTVFCC